MGWTAEATVQDVTPIAGEGSAVSLRASGSDITCDGEDTNILDVQVNVISSSPAHLSVGDKVQIVSNC